MCLDLTNEAVVEVPEVGRLANTQRAVGLLQGEQGQSGCKSSEEVLIGVELTVRTANFPRMTLSSLRAGDTSPSEWIISLRVAHEVYRRTAGLKLPRATIKAPKARRGTLLNYDKAMKPTLFRASLLQTNEASQFDLGAARPS